MYGLLNDAQFLVRYDIGDTGTWSDRICACGRSHLPVLQQLTGRLEDVVIGPDGRELVRFHSLFINLPHVLQDQVVQESLDRLHVRVIADEGFGPAQVQEIQHRLTSRLGDVRVTVERAVELERTSRGKVRAVISHLPRGARSSTG